MTQHDHGKHHGHEHQHHAHQKSALAKNWVIWVAVALMLGAMLMYVLSDDESIQPGGPQGEGLPSDAPPVEAAP
jgi:hypothetical protein